MHTLHHELHAEYSDLVLNMYLDLSDLRPFRYGRPDPLMERPFDVQAKVCMASVRYLHTMRFLKEMIAFISHFPQLIDAFQRMKAMAQGNLVGGWVCLGAWFFLICV